MKEIDRRTSNNNQAKRSGKPSRKDPVPRQGNARKISSAREVESKASQARPESSVLVSDLNVGTEPSEYESLVIHYVDDVNRSEKMSGDSKANAMISQVNKGGSLDDYSSDLETRSKQGKEEESDSETVNGSVSSQGDFPEAEDEKVARTSRTPKSTAKKNSSENGPRASRLRSKVLPYNPRKVTETGRGTTPVRKKTSSDDSNVMDVPHRSSSVSSDDKPIEEEKDIDVLDGKSNNGLSVGSDDETVDNEGNGEDENALDQKIEEMEARIDKLEEELREVAALEISLYSLVAEHGSSAHKVHTPARRLSRLYIHAGKYWTQDKRASIAKNTVSGLVLVAKSCGNDVPRLTFWLSNTIVLREIICQAFGSSHPSGPMTRLSELNGGSKRIEVKSTDQKWKASAGSRQTTSFMHFSDNWQETGTLTAALEKVESWVFSRIVESVWWQALTPNMHSPNDKSLKNRSGRVSGPALGDQQQGSFSIDLWKSAFQDAFQRLCPLRAAGHECGCLPVLARMVMEQCVSRLDVAMFNAILRESVHEVPTDPISDPILDSRVLPIPAGDLSFGSGAQLKNSVGSWSRWLSDMFDMDTDDYLEGDQCSIGDDESRGGKPKSFSLLNSLSDLLMLPKDMLMDSSVRKEVCPSITLPLVKRILCNFTPDEFCPDAVPGSVLEALNAESIVEQRLSGETARSFPYTAAPVVYNPPSSIDVAEKAAEAGGGKSSLSRNASVIQRKGYTSDEELDELDSPLAAFIETMPPSPSIANGNGNGKCKRQSDRGCTNVRYELLRDVWSV